MTVCLENRLWRCLKRGYNYRATGNKRPGVPIDAVRNWFKTHHIIGWNIFPASPPLRCWFGYNLSQHLFSCPKAGFPLSMLGLAGEWSDGQVRARRSRRTAVHVWGWWPPSWASNARLDAAVDSLLRACMTEEAYFSCNANLRVVSDETL